MPLSALILATFVQGGMAALAEDAPTCESCHTTGHKGIPTVDDKALRASPHADLECTDCHEDAAAQPHEPSLSKVACGGCHGEAASQYAKSVHGKASGAGDADAPPCTKCHGTHDILPVANLQSPVSRLKIDNVCIDCHTLPGVTERHKRMPNPEFVRHYLLGVHGRGVHDKGLVVSATCIDCHGPHEIRAPIDPKATTHRSNLPRTCGKCHAGILEDWEASAHGKVWRTRPNDGPVCTDCHESHETREAHSESFRGDIATGCGGCHGDAALSFGDTFHGQSTSLGFVVAAKCSDCHTAHRNLPASDPESSVHPDNLKDTCGSCHPGANENFIGFQPHFRPNDPDQSAVAYGIGSFMKWLLLVVFSAWGLHTLMWLQRSIVAIRRKEFPRESEEGQWVRRFNNPAIATHVVVVVTFLGLVATGLPLMYHHTGWAKLLGGLFGGVEVARYFHRLFAVVTFGYAGYHVFWILRQSRRRGGFDWLLGPDSLVPRWRDVVDLVRNVRWFLYLGPPPPYGRFTYFEKFDYFAVFWGIPVIGLSGLVLWLPDVFTWFLPGIWLNIAHLVHSEEALLAFGFIFTVHFFHSHMRPENFPMDTVVFVGSMPLDRFRRERPDEYEARIAAGTLSEILVPPPSPTTLRWARTFGVVALASGLLLVCAVFITYIGRWL